MQRVLIIISVLYMQSRGKGVPRAAGGGREPESLRHVERVRERREHRRRRHDLI